MSIKLTDNTELFLSAYERALHNGLEAIGMTAETYAKKELYPGHGLDTGRLRNSITYAVETNEKAVYIGTNVEYAPHVELGTSKSKAIPFLKPAATQHTAEYERILKAALDSAK